MFKRDQHKHPARDKALLSKKAGYWVNFSESVSGEAALLWKSYEEYEIN